MVPATASVLGLPLMQPMLEVAFARGHVTSRVPHEIDLQAMLLEAVDPCLGAPCSPGAVCRCARDLVRKVTWTGTQPLAY